MELNILLEELASAMRTRNLLPRRLFLNCVTLSAPCFCRGGKKTAFSSTY